MISWNSCKFSTFVLSKTFRHSITYTKALSNNCRFVTTNLLISFANCAFCFLFVIWNGVRLIYHPYNLQKIEIFIIFLYLYKYKNALKWGKEITKGIIFFKIEEKAVWCTIKFTVPVPFTPVIA